MVSVNAYWLNVQMGAIIIAPFPDVPTKNFSSANRMVDFWTVYCTRTHTYTVLQYSIDYITLQYEHCTVLAVSWQ